MMRGILKILVTHTTYLGIVYVYEKVSNLLDFLSFLLYYSIFTKCFPDELVDFPERKDIS